MSDFPILETTFPLFSLHKTLFCLLFLSILSCSAMFAEFEWTFFYQLKHFSSIVIDAIIPVESTEVSFWDCIKWAVWNHFIAGWKKPHSCSTHFIKLIWTFVFSLIYMLWSSQSLVQGDFPIFHLVLIGKQFLFYFLWEVHDCISCLFEHTYYSF